MTDRANHPAWTDTLTHAGNRRVLYAWLREEARPGAVLLANVDGLADLNASLGRRTADAVIAEAGQRLSRLAAEGDLLVRYGFDEFALVLPGRSRQEAFDLAESICASIASNLLRLPDVPNPIPWSMTLGVSASAPDVPLALGDIVRARRALAAAKKAGRGIALHDEAPTASRPEHDPWAGFPCPAVVGREMELGELVSSTGKLPRVVLVHGPPGIGKTRFVRAAVDRLRGDRAAGSSVTVDEATRFSPFRALGDLLELLAASHPRVVKAARDRLDADQASVIRALSPGFFGEANAVPAWPTPEKAAGGVVAVLNAARDLHPAWVLAVDDAPLADHASLETLQAILLGFPVPILLLLTSGSAEGTAPDISDARLPAMLETLRSRKRLFETALPPLQPPDVKAMIQGILPGSNPSDELAGSLCKASAGVPVIVEETLRELVGSGQVRPDGDLWALPRADSIHAPPLPTQAIMKTFLQLPAAVRDMVNHAAVLGSKFDLDLLQQVLGLNDLEFFERLDLLLDRRLLRPLDPAVPEVLEFASTYLRAAAYKGLDPMARRRIHLRIGTVLAGQEEAVVFAGNDLEFHLERCGATDEAATIRRRMGRRSQTGLGAGHVRVTRIPEGTDTLPPPAASALEAAMKSLAGAVKTARLYPQHNRVKDDFLRAFQNSIETALEASPAVTVRLDEGVMRYNGVAVQGRPGGPQEELQRFLDERQLAAVTFTRGLTFEESQVILEGLAAPMEPGKVLPDHWDRWLSERHLGHADLVQRSFIARAGETMARLRRTELVERPLEDAELSRLALALRHLRAASDSLKLYPPGHAQVEESFQAAAKEFAALLESVDPVTVGSAEGKIVVNGRIADARTLGAGGQSVVDEIGARDLKSLTILRGLTDEELRAIASYFALPRDKAGASAEELLSRPGFVHFQFGALQFRQKRSVTGGEAASEPEKNTLIVKLPGDGRPVRLQRGARADVRARLLLGQDPSRLTEEKTARTFPSLLEALNYGSTCDLAAQLLAHLAAAARQGTDEQRAKAWRLLQDSLDGAYRETARLLVSMTSPAIRDTVSSETEGQVLRAISELLPAYVKAAVETRTTGALHDILRDGIEKRRRDPATPPPVRDWVSGLARRLAASPSMKLLLARLSDLNRDERWHATSMVAALGEPAAGPVVDFLLEERSPHGRQAAAETLATIGPEAVKSLLDRVPSAPPAGLVSALEVAELLGPEAIVTLFRVGAVHPDVAVRDSAAKMVRRVRQAATPALKEGLADPALRILCLKLGTELKLPGLGPEVSKLVDGTEDVNLLGLACRYAAAAKEASMAAALGRVVQRRGGLLKRGLPEGVRGDAAWALGQIPSPEAQHLAREAEKDPSPVVRGAARSGRSGGTTITGK